MRDSGSSVRDRSGQYYIISDRQEWKGRFGVKMTVIRLRALCLRLRYALWGRGAQILARCKTRFDAAFFYAPRRRGEPHAVDDDALLKYTYEASKRSGPLPDQSQDERLRPNNQADGRQRPPELEAHRQVPQ